MLDYFPTLFPDEWWYSVVCRYYLMCGINPSRPLKTILYHRESAQIASRFPNGTLAMVLNQLPQNVFNFDKILEENTLYRYYVRFAPKIEEENMRRSLSQGGNPQITHMRTIYGYNRDWAPRYCPICAKEDAKIYGIQYYHVTHQIPIVSVCPKHGCYLQQISTDPGKGYYQQSFRPLSLEQIDETAAEGSSAEKIVAEIASDYMHKPLSIGMTNGYNNLIQKLINIGYYKFQSKAGRIVDSQRLYQDLIEFYGQELVSYVYGGELTGTHMVNLERFYSLYPDRYILIQGFIGLSFEDFLVNGRIEDVMLQKLIRIRNENEFVTLVDVANQMGLKEHEVIRFAKSCGVEPFWVGKYHKSRNLNAIKKKITFTITEEEYKTICSNARKHGFEGPGEYLIQMALNDKTQKGPI